MKKVYISNVLVFTGDFEKYFFTEFSDSISIVFGRNTAGKSTLLQLLLYCIGINEDKIRLAEILSEDIVCRVDLLVNSEPIQFVRKDDNIFVRQENQRIHTFTGINSNNSAEHIKLKEFLHEIFFLIWN